MSRRISELGSYMFIVIHCSSMEKLSSGQIISWLKTFIAEESIIRYFR
ncbi:unnamed protein product, partial [Rotaria magnacalcarata]